MSNHSPLSNESIGPSGTETEQEHDRSSQYLHSVKGPAQFLSFWVAIALPFLHVPLLAQGLGDSSVILTFLVLLAINVVALYLGHGYNQD
ncbi:hypothetical protein [Natronobacterium gregoryi]|uniref:Uncharacterized protein n=2 Tax=Natronobacterium gregoryi TaxID=44930 RepID=L0AGU9_NATGS|nr:hypothetical protein [Natronobacterium gregoryi]AFZ72634.1 hypothetical protein Natgr_1423 [Natronobacterium gregoryi SP2]ELY69078.1 hypothetical protein C490_08806 [Natronobacterium gregoryi SP2]PLK19108.1 hypothetical protein CYV19_16635 [Natronobacterium gregoryi SP2]SFI90305.1 hypothetical protein SAMN05443661_10915 [Natronobacterium gregoryi]